MLVTSFASYVLFVTISITGLSSIASGACTYAGSPFHIYEEKNSIKSNGFPNRYSGNEDCEWFLHPPTGSLPELLILNLVLETNVDGIPEATNICHRTKNYLNIGHARACGTEGPTCVAFMLHSCHRTLVKYFSNCTTVLTGGWPLKVNFKTLEPDDKKGFQLNYTFVECGANLDEIKKTTARTTTKAVNDGNSTVNAAAQVTEKSSTEYSTSTTTTTTEYDAISKSERAPVASPQTTPTRHPKRTTMKLIKETQQPESQKRNLILTIVLVLVCVLFCIIVIAVIFRKRLRAWVSEKKSPQPNRSQNGSNASYIDAYIIPLEKSRASEPSPYRSPSTSTDASHSATCDKMNDFESGKRNENNNCVGTIENYVYDTIQA